MDADIKERFDRIDEALKALLLSRDTGAAAPRSTSPAVTPATEADLDSDYGNFVVKKCPPRWKGQDFAGKRLSETSAEFCDAVASFKAWAADKDRKAGDEAKAGYADRDRARAEGWAKRLRDGWKAKGGLDANSDEIPF